jgi:hypothetical protein
VSNVLRFSTELDDNVSKKLKGISKAFDKMGGPGSGASFFGNVGAKAVARGFGLIDTAATAVVNVLGDALQAAIDEEASVKKLDTALRANVVGWDGNTDAIERVLTARMVIKTEDGGFRLLKSLGIQIDENATSEEALTAVRKAAEGQALSYANTTAGKLQVAQTKIGEKMEQLGGVIMPAVASALDNISNAIDFFSGDPSVKGSAALEALRDLFRAVGNAVGWVIDKVAKLIGFLGDVISAVGRALKALGELVDTSNAVKAPGRFSNLPGHATGIDFVPETGPAILHRGETVLSPSMSLASGGRGGALSGVTIAGISERQIMDMVDRGLYFRFQRATPTVRRT